LDPFDCGLTLCGTIRVGRWKYISTDQDLYELDYISDDSFWLRSYSKSSNDILNCGDTPDVDEDGNQIDSEVFLYTCDTDEGCLFDLVNDPCEYTNVISSYPDVAQYLRSRLIYYNSSQVDPLTTLMSTASAEMIDPDLFDGYWSPFLDDDEVTFETILESDFQTKKSEFMKRPHHDFQQQDIETLVNRYTTHNKNNENTTNTLWYLSSLIGIIAAIAIFAIAGYYYLSFNKKKTVPTSEVQPLLIK